MPLSIARLISLCALILTVLTLSLGALLVRQVYVLDHISLTLEHYTSGLLKASELRYSTAQIQQFYTDASLTLEADSVQKAQDNYRQALRTREELERLLPEFASQLRALQSALEGLNQSGQRMVDAYRQQGKSVGDQLMQRFDERSATTIAAFGALFEPLQKEYARLEQEAEQTRSGMLYSNLGAWAVALSVVLGTLGWLHRRILPPVRRLHGSLKALNSGRGDLGQQLVKTSDDELGQVVEAFNQFVGHLATQMSTVTSVAQSLDGASRSLVTDAQAAEDSAEHLQTEVAQVATAVNQMSASVREVTRSAQSSAEQTRDANTQSQVALKVVNTAIKDIQGLASEVEQASHVIQALEQHTQEIGGVLEVIRTIAEQTNLLALNAAIEAARAGDQGRGFAVVADEVRTLASRTQTSTQEIQSMIERLQSSAREAVAVMLSGRDHAEHSVQQALEAGTSLQNIRNLVESVSEQSLHIAEAAYEQASVTEEINKRIHNVAQVAEQNLKLAENTLSRGRTTEQDAGRLGGIVRQFNL